MRLASLRRVAVWFVTPLLAAFCIFIVSYLIAAGIKALDLSGSQPFSDSGWAQAVGTVFAIVAGFATVFYQVQRQKADIREQQKEAGRAAFLLAFDALDTVSDRLNAALTFAKNKSTHRLRGNRTTEMVTAMREFEISRIPASMLADFIRLRSRIYAINERITEIYMSQESMPADWTRQERELERHRQLYSAVQVRRDAVTLYGQLMNTAVSLGANTQNLNYHPAIENYTSA